MVQGEELGVRCSFKVRSLAGLTTWDRNRLLRMLLRHKLAYYSSHRWRYQLKGPVKTLEVHTVTNSNKVREDIADC
jgi:hypothetical protein